LSSHFISLLSFKIINETGQIADNVLRVYEVPKAFA
jgi:hypothetical protein